MESKEEKWTRDGLDTRRLRKGNTNKEVTSMSRIPSAHQVLQQPRQRLQRRIKQCAKTTEETYSTRRNVIQWEKMSPRHQSSTGRTNATNRHSTSLQKSKGTEPRILSQDITVAGVLLKLRYSVDMNYLGAIRGSPF